MQTWNPEQYTRNAAFVPELGLPVLELLDPQPGEHILDLGCGDGVLTRKLLDQGCRVTGVDASPDMIRAARDLGVDAHVVDGQALEFDQSFDAVFTNAALHWMPDSEKVVAGVWRALRPGGRFVGEFGGHGNVATIVDALESALAARGVAVPSPWYFPREEAYRAVLESGGFVVTMAERHERPTPLPGDVTGWLETFAKAYTAELPDTEVASVLNEVRTAVRPALRDENGHWFADYVRLRFSAYKPGE